MKINLKIKRNTKVISVRDIPVYSGSTIVSFKKVLVSSENKSYDDAVMTIYTNEADALELKKLGYVIVEKSFNDAVIYRAKLGIYDVINGRVFLRYPFNERRFYVESSTDYVTEDGRHYYKVLLNGMHGVAKGDYDSCSYASITIFNQDGDELCELTDWFVDEEKDKIYINANIICAPESGYYVVLNFDPIVYNDVKDAEGEEKYPGDWHFYSEANESVKTSFIYDNPVINVPIGVSSDTDYMGLKQNENVDEYYKKLTKGIVPDFINTEKTKYIPYIYSGSSKNEEGLEVDKLNGPATRIEFYLHFRNRAKEVVTTDANNVKVYGGMPSDSWSVETEETLSLNKGETKIRFWNNFSNYYDIKETNDKLYVGDLVGNLGFTDGDVLNRKKKIKQSFIRLSFYNSNNPIQTSMLFTSTVFFDINKLYSKYIKLYTSKDYNMIMSDYSKSVDRGDSYDNHWGLVLFDGKPAVDGTYSYGPDELLTAELDVTSENEHTSSAEGFNLYLFSDDSPKEDEERTIYMKVEFNHAGYGRKFPMILWPTKDGVPVPLTRENFYEYLYIPVVVSYDAKNNKYFYYIKGAKNDTDGNVIKLALFEPKVEPL